jgi:hypothetical protein
VSRRLKLRRVPKCADMKMRFVRALPFAGQRRAAPGAKSAPPPGRRIEPGDLPLSNGIRVALEGHKDRNRRAAMLPTTFAMAPHHRFRLTAGHEAYGAAQTAPFELIAHAAELSASKLAVHGKDPLETRLPPVDCPSLLRCQSRSKGRRRRRSEREAAPSKGNASPRVYDRMPLEPLFDFGPRGLGAPLWPQNASNGGWPLFSPGCDWVRLGRAGDER